MIIIKCAFRCFTDDTPHLLTFLAESPLVLCGIVPTWWLQDHMAEILLEKPGGGYGWSSKLGRSLTVPEFWTLLILRYEVGVKLDSLFDRREFRH